jgi:hypothetical protein
MLLAIEGHGTRSVNTRAPESRRWATTLFTRASAA